MLTTSKPPNVANHHCEVCGDQFKPRTPQNSLCSNKCRKEKQKKTELAFRGKKGSHNTIECESCGKPVVQYTKLQKRCKTCKPIFVAASISKKMKDYLDEQGNVSEYIRNLIQKDMNHNL